MEEYERAISVIKEYIETNLFEPKLTWPKHEFDLRCYSRWAAEELLERIINESERLPEYLTGRVARRPLDLVKEFLDEVHTYLLLYDDSKTSMIFYTAERTAIDIILLFYKTERRH